MEAMPPMPLESWSDSKETLHRFAQIVGKIRLAASPMRNHWWNVPFHLTGRGITTRPMGRPDVFTIDFDFVDHRLLIQPVAGEPVTIPLTDQSVASFYRRVFEALDRLGVAVSIRPVPFGLPGPAFPDDTEHATYDPLWVNRYWRVLSQVNLILEEFAGRYSGKTSPVHHFWHSLDIAVTRFSDRTIAPTPGADPVTREAYSREVVSFGFWFGDDSFGEPAFYSYTAPEPPGLSDVALRPGAAQWLQRPGSLAVLRYDDARALPDPAVSVLDFWESAYQAGAGLAGWDIDGLSAPGGFTSRPG
jgi:hypothetical protein